MKVFFLCAGAVFRAQLSMRRTGRRLWPALACLLLLLSADGGVAELRRQAAQETRLPVLIRHQGDDDQAEAVQVVAVVEVEGEGVPLTVLYVPSAKRAGIASNGNAMWTDAASIGDAIGRYIRGGMRA